MLKAASIHFSILALVTLVYWWNLTPEKGWRRDDRSASIVIMLQICHLLLYAIYYAVLYIFDRTEEWQQIAQEGLTLFTINLVTHFIVSVLGILLYILSYKNIQEDRGRVMIITCSASFLCLIVFALVITLYCGGLRNAYSLNSHFYELDDEKSGGFNELPSIIFNDKSKIDQKFCLSCNKRFESGDILKVIPGCYHLFHGI